MTKTVTKGTLDYNGRSLVSKGMSSLWGKPSKGTAKGDKIVIVTS